MSFIEWLDPLRPADGNSIIGVYQDRMKQLVDQAGSADLRETFMRAFGKNTQYWSVGLVSGASYPANNQHVGEGSHASGIMVNN